MCALRCVGPESVAVNGKTIHILVIALLYSLWLSEMELKGEVCGGPYETGATGRKAHSLRFLLDLAFGGSSSPLPWSLVNKLRYELLLLTIEWRFGELLTRQESQVLSCFVAMNLQLKWQSWRPSSSISSCRKTISTAWGGKASQSPQTVIASASTEWLNFHICLKWDFIWIGKIHLLITLPDKWQFTNAFFRPIVFFCR